MTVIQTFCEQKTEALWVTKNVDIYVYWIAVAEMGDAVQDAAVEFSFFFIVPQWSSFNPWRMSALVFLWHEVQCMWKYKFSGDFFPYNSN